MTNYEKAEYEFLKIIKSMPGDGQFFHFEPSAAAFESVAHIMLDVVTWSEFTEEEILRNSENGTLKELVLARLNETCDMMTDKVVDLKHLIEGKK